MSAAISKAKEFGLNKISIPTAGNAGGATAAYTSKAGQESFIFMPSDTPKPFQVECEQYGAHIEMVNGFINDCGKIIAERKEKEGWFDISTLKEPYRVEGKKPWAMNWQSNLIGNYRMVLFILLEAEQALSACGKPLMKWKNSVGLDLIDLK